MIRADIGQARTGRHMRRHALQAHGQCLFVQLQPLFTTNVRHLWPDRGAILSSNAVHFNFMRQGPWLDPYLPLAKRRKHHDSPRLNT
ncbi:hypothetical protein D3C84_388260 [compost metagenome]